MMAYAQCIRCDERDSLIDGLCEPCAVTQTRLDIHSIEADGGIMTAASLLLPVCGYCRASVPRGGLTRHDIMAHGGLARVRSDHALVCLNPNRIGTDCMCRVDEYEALVALA